MWTGPSKKATSIDFIAHCAWFYCTGVDVNISRSISIARDLLLAFQDAEDLPCLQDHRLYWRTEGVFIRTSYRGQKEQLRVRVCVFHLWRQKKFKRALGLIVTIGTILRQIDCELLWWMTMGSDLLLYLRLSFIHHYLYWVDPMKLKEVVNLHFTDKWR